MQRFWHSCCYSCINPLSARGGVGEQGGVAALLDAVSRDDEDFEVVGHGPEDVGDEGEEDELCETCRLPKEPAGRGNIRTTNLFIPLIFNYDNIHHISVTL